MPFFAATYASNVDKIFATMGPYIVRCNPLTGAREAVTKLGAPIYGEMPICYHAGTGMLFVGAGTTPNKQFYNAYGLDPPVFKDIYQVNPNTMAITPCAVNTYTAGFGAQPFIPSDSLRGGPYHIIADGAFILFHFRFHDKSSAWGRMNATSFVCNGDWVYQWAWEQLAVDGTYLYTCDPYQREVQIYNKTLGYPSPYVSSPDITPYQPVSLCYSTADSKPWVVCGDENLVRLNSQVDLDYTQYDLTAVSGPTVTPDPCRIQCLADGYLYLPCMTPNGVIRWNPLTGTGVWYSGFEGPMDIIETPTKKFVVQNSPVGLKELVI